MRVLTKVLGSSVPNTPTTKLSMTSPQKALIAARTAVESAKRRATDTTARAEKAKMLRETIESKAFEMFKPEQQEQIKDLYVQTLVSSSDSDTMYM